MFNKHVIRWVYTFFHDISLHPIVAQDYICFFVSTFHNTILYFSSCISSRLYTVYTVHTRVTLKLLTPPRRFGHWTRCKILLIAKWRGKTELVKRESRSVVSKHGDKSDLGLGNGRKRVSTVNCTHLIKQSMTASPRKALVQPKNFTELDPTNSKYPLLNLPQFWISKLNFEGYAV